MSIRQKQRGSTISKTVIPTQMAVAVDLVVLTVRENKLCALVVERGIEPYKGRLALPGGFVRDGEDLDQAALRELHEETGLSGTFDLDRAASGKRTNAIYLEQLRTYGTPKRDPRQRVIAVAYLALAPNLPLPKAGGDAQEASWEPVSKLLETRLAFDHARILEDGCERAAAKLEYTTLATRFCAPTFTISELRSVYDVVWNSKLEQGNFARKVANVPGMVIATDAFVQSEAGRPARLYRAGPAHVLHPPILRAHE